MGKYEAPVWEVSCFEIEDVILTSGESGGGNDNGNEDVEI